MKAFEEELRKDMINIYNTAKKEINYKPSHLLKMISNIGAYETAIRIVTKQNVTSDFERLWESGRLDLSVEALLIRKYSKVFSQEVIEMCKKNLSEYKYIEKVSNESDIRIIPMNKEEFANKSIEQVQCGYFKGELINENKCEYYYRTKGIKCEQNTLFLFQYDNHIIASAILEEIEIFPPDTKGEYRGAWKLKQDSICVFEPITCEELQYAVPELSRFSQAKQIIDSKYRDKISELIQRKAKSIIAEEITAEQNVGLIEGAKKGIYVNAYERNTVARDKCISYYKKKDDGKVRCQICGFCFEDFYGEEFKDKIHVHHIKALAEINEEYEVDPIKDLLPVCPNCHLAVHSNEGGYSVDFLKSKIKNRDWGSQQGKEIMYETRLCKRR